MPVKESGDYFLFDAGFATSSKVIQGREVDGMSGNYAEQETISMRGFLFW